MVCDLAQTYHILNYKELSPEMVAALVLGLGNDSRVKMKLSNRVITTQETLLAIIADSAQFLAWSKTKDAKRGHYKQKSILKILQGEYDKPKEELQSFKTVEEFEEYMNSFISG